MSTLYKEALIEAQKLKEMAEEGAKKKILEDISPLIKKAISDQINEDVSDSFFLEDGSEDPMPVDGSVEDAAGELAGVTPTAPVDMGVGEVPSAPLAPKGQENVMSATMPGQDGKITVDFEDLFSPNDPLVMGEPADVEAPLSPEPTADMAPDMGMGPLPTKEAFERSLSETATKISEAFYAESITVLGKENLQQKLFQLLESNDYLKENKVFNQKEATKNENKLEFLFLRLKEAKVSNSYIENNHRDNNMKSLKEYAARLFEEDTSFAGAGDKDKLNHKSTASDEHAKKQSGVSPEVGGTADLKAATEKQNGKTPAEKPWAEGEPTVKEEVEAKGSAGFGDGEGASVEFDEAELKEAIAALTGKPEKDKGWEEGDPEAKDPSHAKLKEDISDEIMPTDPMGADMDADVDVAAGAAVEPDLVLNIDLPDELEAVLSSLDLSTIGVEVDAPAGDAPEGDMDAPAMDVDAADPTLDVGADVDAGDADLDLDLGDEGEELDEGLKSDKNGHVEGSAQYRAGQVNAEKDRKEKEDRKARGEAEPKAGLTVAEMKEAFIKLLSKQKMLEAKLAQVETENKALKESSTKDRDALKEANLFLAKNVYFTKFLQRGDLSKKNLEKIVEHLDRANSVNDAKKIYSKIKAKLAESANASKKLAGSPSKVTAPGSAKTTLKESATHSAETEESTFDTNRWAVIAGIKPQADN